MASKPSTKDIERFSAAFKQRSIESFNKRARGVVEFKFSKHFFDRVEQRASWDDLGVLNQMVQNAIKYHLCEMLYWAHLPNRSHRLEIRRGKYVVGCIYSDTFNRIICTTFVNNRKYDGEQNPFVITVR